MLIGKSCRKWTCWQNICLFFVSQKQNKIVLLKYQISFTHFLSVFAVYWVYLVRKHLPTYYVCYIRDEIIIDHLLRDIKIEIKKIENHPSQKNRQIYQIDFSIDF